MKVFFEKFLIPALFVAAVIAGTPARAMDNTIRVVVFGDSLTSGFKLQPEQAYAARLDRKLREVGFSNVQVINMSVAGETTSEGYQRFDTLRMQHPDVAVLELGTNDELRGLSPEQAYANLAAIVSQLVQDKAYVVIMGAHPAGLDPNVIAQYDAIYQRLGDAYRMPVYLDILDSIAGKPELNLADRLHPNAKGVEAMVEATYRLVDTGVRWKYEALQYQEQYQQQQQPVPFPPTN